MSKCTTVEACEHATAQFCVSDCSGHYPMARDTNFNMSMIQWAMDSFWKGRAAYVIAHRLTTIRDTDLILAMHFDSIVEKSEKNSGGFCALLYNC